MKFDLVSFPVRASTYCQFFRVLGLLILSAPLSATLRFIQRLSSSWFDLGPGISLVDYFVIIGAVTTSALCCEASLFAIHVDRSWLGGSDVRRVH